MPCTGSGTVRSAHAMADYVLPTQWQIADAVEYAQRDTPQTGGSGGKRIMGLGGATK